MKQKSEMTTEELEKLEKKIKKTTKFKSRTSS